MIPSCDQTGVPIHFHSSTTSGSASLMSLRILPRAVPRQSPSSAILFEMSSDADGPWRALGFFMVSRSPVPAGSPPMHRGSRRATSHVLPSGSSSARRLPPLGQLHRDAFRTLDEDQLARMEVHQLVAHGDAVRPEPGHLGLDVVHGEAHVVEAPFSSRSMFGSASGSGCR